MSQLADLDKMIAKVRSAKLAKLKTASPGDGVDDGTKPVETGAQLASNKEESGKPTPAAVDGAAVTNPAGASLTQSTDGAVAVATSGQAGGEASAPFKIDGQAANGPEGGIGGDDKKVAAFLAQLKTAADGLPGVDAARTFPGDVTPGSFTAPDASGQVPGLGKVTYPIDSVASEEAAKLKTPGLGSQAMSAAGDWLKDPVHAGIAGAGTVGAAALLYNLLSKKHEKTASVKAIHPFVKHLIKKAHNSPAFCKAAAEAGADEGAQGSQVVDQLLQGLESGQITEEQAEQILMEALKSGAISDADVAPIMEEIHKMSGGAGAGAPDAGGAPAPAAGGGDPMAGMTPPPGAGAAGPEGAAPDMAPPDPSMEAKAAAAHVGPEHADYVKKLAYFYAAEKNAGYAAGKDFGLKLAANLKKQAEEDAVLRKEAEEAVLKEIGMTREQVTALFKTAEATLTPAQVKIAQYKTQIHAAVYEKIAKLNATK